jgi:flagellar hook-associated protein 2
MSTSGAQAISGVSTGIDWRATVDSLMEIEGQRVTALQTSQSNSRQQMAAWRSLGDRFTGLQDMLNAYKSLDSFLSKAVSSSDGDVLTATAGSGAVTGTYDIEVDQMATNSRLIHGGFADLNSTQVNSSGFAQQFSYTYGSGGDQQTITVNVPNGTTLSGLKDLINRDSNNPGVKATIINDGSGSATAWHLVLASSATGADSAIGIDDTLTTLGDGDDWDTAAFPDVTLGVNARIRVNGFPASSWIESQSNTVSDVIEGVTLTLKDVTTDGPVALTVNEDSAAVKAKIEGFVNTYNSIQDTIASLSNYNPATETRGLLFGDAALQQMKRSLQNLTNRPVTGIPADNAYTNLSQLGLTTGTSGKITIDSEKLTEALETNFDDVGRLFAQTNTSGNSAVSFFSRRERTAAGDVAVSVTYDPDGQPTSATLNGVAATVEGQFLVGAVGTDLEGLRLLFTDPGDGGGTLNTTVGMSLGVSGSFTGVLDSITNEEYGNLQYQTDRLETTIERYTNSIEDQQRRLLQIRAKYERQYLAMEEAISRYQSQGNYLSSQLSSL